MDFLKIDLDDSEQCAVVRLVDQPHLRYPSQITEAHFDCGGAQIVRFHGESKPKRFTLSTDEIEMLVAAWTEYQARIAKHEADAEAYRKQIIAEAKALASSIKFDLPDLNVRAKRDGNTWTVMVPAIGFERYADIDDLVETVQDALDQIARDVDSAQEWHWGSWDNIIASYERAIATCRQCGKDDLPLNQETRLCVRCLVDNQTAQKKAEQGGPAEIVEARKLLSEAGMEEWAIEKKEDIWHFRAKNDFSSLSGSNKNTADVLEEVRVYLDRVDAVLNDQAVPEPAEIAEARKLLTEAGIEEWAIKPCTYPTDTWDFDGPFGNGGEFSMFSETPTGLLEGIREYVERKQSDKLLDAMEQEIFEQESPTIDDETTEPFGAFAGDC